MSSWRRCVLAEQLMPWVRYFQDRSERLHVEIGRGGQRPGNENGDGNFDRRVFHILINQNMKFDQQTSST